MPKKKKIICIFVLILACFVYGRVLKSYDYFRNSTLEVVKKDGEYTGTVAYYLNEGDYSLEISYSSDEDFDVQLVSLDNRNVLAKKTLEKGEHTEYIDFSVNQKLRAVDLVFDAPENLEIKEIYYESNMPVYTDRFFIIGLTVVGAAVCVYLYRKKKYDLLVVIGIGLFVSLPFIGKDLKTGHDLYFHLERIFNIGLQFSRGNFLSRINDANIYAMGSITPAIYPELFLYLPGLMVGLNASVVLSYKALCILINIGTGLICYYAASRITNKRIALIAVFIYLFNPYRMNDIFVRSAVGESLATMFMPLALYGVYELIQGNYRRGSFGAIIGISGVLQSHLLSIVVFIGSGVGYALIYVVLHWKVFWSDKKRILWIVVSALFTVLMNIGFIVPFLRYDDPSFAIKNTVYTLENNAGSIYRLFIDTYSNRSIYNGMSISLGTGMLLGIILIIEVLLTKKDFKYKGIALGSLIISLFAVWMSSELFPWNTIQYSFGLYNVIGLLQFPWRLLIVASPLFSLSIAIVADNLICENKKVLPVAVMVFCLISGLRSMEGYFTQNEVLMDNKSDYFPVVYNADYFRANGNTGAALNSIRNRITVSSDEQAVFDYDFDKCHVINYEGITRDTIVDVPVYYYDNLYTLKINGETAEYECSDIDTVRVHLKGNEGNGTITVEVNQKQFMVTDLISIMMFVILVVIRIRRKDFRESTGEVNDEGCCSFGSLL